MLLFIIVAARAQHWPIDKCGFLSLGSFHAGMKSQDGMCPGSCTGETRSNNLPVKAQKAQCVFRHLASHNLQELSVSSLLCPVKRIMLGKKESLLCKMEFL